MAGESLQPGSVVNTDGLGCFFGVEAEGCEQQRRVTGGKHGCEVLGLLRLISERSDIKHTILGKVKRSLDGTTMPLGRTAHRAT